jgi:hypothetical protein
MGSAAPAGGGIGVMAGAIPGKKNKSSSKDFSWVNPFLLDILSMQADEKNHRRMAILERLFRVVNDFYGK